MTIRGRRYIRVESRVLAVYQWTEGRDAVGVDFTTTDGLSFAESAPYEPLSVRQEDMDRAQAEGYSISIRARVKLSPFVRSALAEHSRPFWAKVDGRLYRVESANADRTHAFLDLSQEVSDGTARLLARTHAKDAYGNLVDEWDGPEVHVRRANPAGERETSAGADSVRQSIAVAVRPCDWGAGYPRVSVDGLDYTVEGASGDGHWVTVTATRKVGD